MNWNEAMLLVFNWNNADEIVSAKDKLWIYCVTFMDDKSLRRDSSARLKQDVDVGDISTVFKRNLRKVMQIA